jgi:hypothetical protein
VVDLVVRVLDLDDGAVHEHANGDGDAGERHEVRVEPISFMGMKASATDTGMVMMGTMDDGKCQRKTG